MAGEQIYNLNDVEIEALKNALSTVLVRAKGLSRSIDVQTSDPSILDPLHQLIAAERSIAQNLLELLERSTGIQISFID